MYDDMKKRAITDDRICHIIGSAIAHREEDGITPSMHLRHDLGIDSIGLMSIVYMLEEQMGVDVSTHVNEFVSAEHVFDIINIVRRG